MQINTEKLCMPIRAGEILKTIT